MYKNSYLGTCSLLIRLCNSGGGLQTGADGKHIRTADQADSCKNYVTLKNAMELGQPIGVVIGKQAANKRE